MDKIIALGKAIEVTKQTGGWLPPDSLGVPGHEVPGLEAVAPLAL